ncbi:MAG: hypothetical protein J2P51_03365 [Hyphomicrobiaceae bacterium]|nr:hypothetical protein [Hyphomicrobiaceae bacterium]
MAMRKVPAAPADPEANPSTSAAPTGTLSSLVQVECMRDLPACPQTAAVTVSKGSAITGTASMIAVGPAGKPGNPERLILGITLAPLARA